MDSHLPAGAAVRGTVRIPIGCDLRSTNVPHLQPRITERLAEAESARAGVVEVDLRGARMVDSVGLNLLVSIIRRARGWGGSTRFLVDERNVQRTMQFTRLSEHTEVVFDPRG